MERPLIWVAPLLGVSLSLFLGLFFTLVIQYSKRIKSFYLLGLNTGFSIFVVLALYFCFVSWQTNRRYGYNPFNQSILLEFTDDSVRRQFVSTGFERLQSQWIYPRDLLLRSYYFRNKDTLIDKHADTVHTVYYTYNFAGNPTLRFSKISICRDRPTMLEFNLFTDTSKEYGLLKEEMKIDEAESRENMLRVIDQMPDDSLGKMLKKFTKKMNWNK